MNVVYTRLGNIQVRRGRRRSLVRAAGSLALGMAYLGAAALRRGPGIAFHLAVARRAIGLLRSQLPRGQVFNLAAAPLDSFRYFEFDFFWRSVAARRNLGDWLDVSSPRLFNLRVLDSGKARSAVLTNPDRKDLAATAQLFDAAGVAGRCELLGSLVSELNAAPASFDTVSCISVLEHIPSREALDALRTMWDVLRPGGTLLLSVPCAREGFEEYIDFNEYGLLRADADEFVFGQRFYDQSTLDEQILCITGAPVRQAVFGEKQPGTFLRNRHEKLHDPDYAHWREPYLMAAEFQHFPRIDALPGLGVIAFEFVKP
jgi:SAM-dependent methyltransferase